MALDPMERAATVLFAAFVLCIYYLGGFVAVALGTP